MLIESQTIPEGLALGYWSDDYFQEYCQGLCSGWCSYLAVVESLGGGHVHTGHYTEVHCWGLGQGEVQGHHSGRHHYCQNYYYYMTAQVWSVGWVTGGGIKEGQLWATAVEG